MKRRNPRRPRLGKGPPTSEGSDFIVDQDFDDWDEDEIMDWVRDNPTTSV